MALCKASLSKTFESTRARYRDRNMNMYRDPVTCAASEDDSLSYERPLGRGGGGEVHMVSPSKLNNVLVEK